MDSALAAWDSLLWSAVKTCAAAAVITGALALIALIGGSTVEFVLDCIKKSGGE